MRGERVLDFGERRRSTRRQDELGRRMGDDPADRTHVECAWAFPAEVAAEEGFDASYAVDFWDLTNRQDWAACESVQRGLRSGLARPGPLSPEEDGVYQFVTRVARAYQGEKG